MSKPKIGIILGSTRDNRFADAPASWVSEVAGKRESMEFEVLDLRDYDLPFFNERASNAWVPTQDPEGVRWQNKLAGLDGFIFITPEYNHAVPAVLKNALDFASPEWRRKPAAYVGYGMVGAARAVQQLKLTTVELQMAPVRSAVHILGADFMSVAKGEKTLGSIDYLNDALTALLDDLEWWTFALRGAILVAPRWMDVSGARLEMFSNPRPGSPTADSRSVPPRGHA